MKELSEVELLYWTKKIKPIIKIGPFKFWAKNVGIDDDLKHLIIYRPASLEKIGQLQIVLPAVGYKGNYAATPRQVISEIAKEHFLPIVDGYSLKAKEPETEFGDFVGQVDVYHATILPKKFTLETTFFAGNHAAIDHNIEKEIQQNQFQAAKGNSNIFSTFER